MPNPSDLLQIKGFRVATELFTSGYRGGAGPCQCNAQCCARGAYVDVAERDRILAHAELIAPHLDETQTHDAKQWFDAEEQLDTDFPSGRCAGTAMVNGKCAMLDQHGRCSTQVAANAAGMHKWALKPLYCALFPIEVIDGVIRFDARLQNERACCSVQPVFDTPLFEACREELVRLVGEDGFAQMRAHYTEHHEKRVRQLPVIAAP
jgi:uncharacterized protein DUF3109